MQSGLGSSWTSPETCSQRVYLDSSTNGFILSFTFCFELFEKSPLKQIYLAGNQEPRMGRGKANIRWLVVEGIWIFISVFALPLGTGLRTKKPGGSDSTKHTCW